MDSFDVVIAGGGCVGASLACALIDSGLRVALVEAVPPDSEQQPSYDDRGLALSLASKRILEGIGVWAELAGNIVPIRCIHVTEQGRFASVRLEAQALGMEALGYVVIARNLGGALARRLKTDARCEWLCPARVMTTRSAAEGVEIEVQQAGATVTLKAKLLVVADGTDSRLRDKLGAGVREHDYGQTAIVSNVTTARAHANTAHERFTRQGPLALLPLPDSRYGAVFTRATAEAARVASLPDGEFLTELRRQFSGRAGDFTHAGKRRCYPLRRLLAGQAAGQRWVIVGNAAHTLHPNGAQGLNLGLRDVAVLGELLVAAARAGEDPGAEKVTTAYAQMRRKDVRCTLAFSSGLAELFYNDRLMLGALRQGVMLATGLLPPLKHSLVRLASGLLGPVPKLARGVPL